MVKARPTIETDRLLLRPLTMADAPDLQRLAGDRDIAANTLRIPHPYPPGEAERWIRVLLEQGSKDELVFAITLRSDNTLVGAVGIGVNQTHNRADMGYWIGKPYWNQGYATEAAGAVLKYAFETLGLNRVYASHFSRNPASGRVLQKIGMRYEGRLRQHVEKWGVYEDLEHYGILRSDCQALKPE